MRVRFVVEAEVTDPPPDYLEKLTKVVQRECRFMLGNSAKVVSSEWLDDSGAPERMARWEPGTIVEVPSTEYARNLLQANGIQEERRGGDTHA